MKSEREKLKLDPFYGKQNNSVRCPVPDCGHIGLMITKARCRIAHGMERDEIAKLYGYPKQIGRGWAFINDNNL